jgi:hypothetical protein
LKVKVQPRPQTITQARAELSRRLEARREEIEAAVMTRVYSVSDTKDLDPTYAEGLKAAVTAAVDYGLLAIELGEERSPPPPPILLAQARMAARAGISLDTVLRRYFAGHALLGDFLIEEAHRVDLKGRDLQRLLRTQATLFDRLLAAVSDEHARESRQRPTSTERRKAEKIERLLAGEMIDVSGFDYDFEGHHLALVTQGEGAAESIRELAQSLDRRLLSLHREDSVSWAWLGGRQQADTEQVERHISTRWPGNLFLALGVPSQGLLGWRLGHRQAEAALPVAQRGSDHIVHYADVALLASMLQDDLLATSLREVYLKPLEEERDGGEMLRKTLRAYFAAGRNASSAAAALGVKRHTVTRRLRKVEERISRPLMDCAIEFEAALKRHQMESQPLQPHPSAAG